MAETGKPKASQGGNQVGDLLSSVVEEASETAGSKADRLTLPVTAKPQNMSETLQQEAEARAARSVKARECRAADSGIPERFVDSIPCENQRVIDAFFGQREERTEAKRFIHDFKVRVEVLKTKPDVARELVERGVADESLVAAAEAERDRELPAVLEGLKAAREEYAKCCGTGLVIAGEKGSHKTHLASTISNLCLERGIKVWQITTVELLDRVKRSFDDPKNDDAERLIRRAEECEVLVLDDFGKEVPSDWAIGNVLFRILNTRYNQLRDTVITTQFNTVEEMTARLRSRGADETAVEAVVRRMYEEAIVYDSNAEAIPGMTRPKSTMTSFRRPLMPIEQEAGGMGTSGYGLGPQAGPRGQRRMPLR